MNAPDLLPPESPVAAAVSSARLVLFHATAMGAHADALVHALAGIGRDDLERQVSNWRERQRPSERYLESLVQRLSEVAP